MINPLILIAGAPSLSKLESLRRNHVQQLTGKHFIIKLDPKGEHPPFMWPFKVTGDIDKARIRAVELYQKFNDKPDRRCPEGIATASVMKPSAKGGLKGKMVFVDQWDGWLWSSARDRGTSNSRFNRRRIKI